MFFVGELYHSFDVLSGEHLACGVAGVDDHDGPHVALLLPLLDGPLQLLHVQGPVPLLIQVVSDLLHAVLGQRGAVERVLGDGDHHPGLLDVVSAGIGHQLEDGADALAGSGTEHHVPPVTLYTSITVCDVRCHVSPEC